MLKTLRAKLILSFTAIAVLSLLLAVVVMLLLARDAARKSSFETLGEKSALAVSYVRLLLRAEINANGGIAIAPNAQLLRGAKESIRAADLRVLFVDPETYVIKEDTAAKFDASGQQFNFNIDIPNLDQKLMKNWVQGTVVLPGGDPQTYQYYAQRVSIDARGSARSGARTQTQPRPSAPYIVIIAQHQPQYATLLGQLDDYVVPAILVALGVSLLVAFLLSRQISRPVARLATATAAMSRGEYEHRVAVEGNDEFAVLSHQFNEMAEEVDRAHRMQRDFVANVSHDLKTPLTSIQGFSQAILDGAVRSESDYKQAAQIINEEAQRMSRLVNEILGLAHLQSGLSSLEMRPLNLAPVVSQVVLAMQPQASSAGVSLVARYSQSGDIVLADTDRLKQVVTNLVENAVKHTPNGGTVTVRLTGVAGKTTIEVQDTGPGIPPDELRRVTERFYQVDKARSTEGRSLGLGLAIAREIVQAHGGDIDIESTVGVGTKVRVTLPSQSLGSGASARVRNQNSTTGPIPWNPFGGRGPGRSSGHPDGTQPVESRTGAGAGKP